MVTQFCWPADAISADFADPNPNADRRELAVDEVLGHAAEVRGPERVPRGAGAPVLRGRRRAGAVAAAVQHPHLGEHPRCGRGSADYPHEMRGCISASGRSITSQVLATHHRATVFPIFQYFSELFASTVKV